jgi:hypothetical protein
LPDSWAQPPAPAPDAAPTTAEQPPAPEPVDEREQSFPGPGWLHPPDDPDPLEAAALAGAFAADYLSWDESSPQRRGEVLLQYLPSDVRGNASLLGWSGKGRQRSEFALPGAVRPDGEGRVVVDVRVRVTPYKAVGIAAEPAYEPAEDMEVAGVPSCAPAPTARGWKSLDSYWVRLAVPVARDHGRLVVDTWDEALEDDPAPPAETPAAAVPDPSTAEPGAATTAAPSAPAAPTKPADKTARNTVKEAGGSPTKAAGTRSPRTGTRTAVAKPGRATARGRAAASSNATRESETGGAP